MSALQAIFSGYLVADPEADRWWSPWGASGRKTDSGAKVSPESSLGLAAYYACLRNISEDIGKLPLKVYRHIGPREREEARDEKLYSLLHDAPNPEMSAISFRESVTHHAIGWGGGFAEIERDGPGEISAFWPIHPSRIKIERAPDGALRYRVKTGDLGAQDAILRPEDVLHIHGLGGNGLSGYILSMLAAQTIGIGLQSDKFAARFYGEGIHPTGYLSHPQTLDKDAKDNIKLAYKTEYGGADNSHGMMVLAEGMEWKSLSIPPEEAQFLQTRQFEVVEIARWFRMPPHKLQDLIRSTFSNITEQNIEYVTDCLMPWSVRWEQELKRKCFSGQPDLFAEHNFNGLLRGDPQKRGIFYRIMWGVGSMSQDDIRAAENMNPIPGGHGATYYVPSNVTPSEIAVTGQVNSSAGGTAAGTSNEDNLNSAHQPVFEDALRRVLTKESKAVDRAAKKHDAEGFADWAADFYVGHRDYVVKSLAPIARAFAKLHGDGEQLDQVLADFAVGHCAASKMDLRGSVVAGELHDRWLGGRVPGEAVALMTILANGEDHDG